MINPYRQGAIGALLDIYEQAISDLKKVIEDIPDEALTIIIDPPTADENCKSIQANFISRSKFWLWLCYQHS